MEIRITLFHAKKNGIIDSSSSDLRSNPHLACIFFEGRGAWRFVGSTNFRWILRGLGKFFEKFFLGGGGYEKFSNIFKIFWKILIPPSLIKNGRISEADPFYSMWIKVGINAQCLICSTDIRNEIYSEILILNLILNQIWIYLRKSWDFYKNYGAE